MALGNSPTENTAIHYYTLNNSGDPDILGDNTAVGYYALLNGGKGANNGSRCPCAQRQYGYGNVSAGAAALNDNTSGK